MLYGDGIYDNTLALQKMLDERGIVTIDSPGTYLVSKTLIIHSNTRLILSPGAKLLAAPLSKCALIENEHFAGGGRDENIEIVGGIWDGNCDEMGLDAVYEAKHRLDEPYSPSLFKGKLIRFCHIDRLYLSRMTVRNPVSYGIQIGDAKGFVVRDMYFDYNWHFGTTDGVHINGPAYDGVLENFSGTTNDDMIGMTTYDESHAECSLGNIENIYIHNITANNAYSGIRLLSGENCDMRAVHIDGLYGNYRHNGVIVSNHNKRPGRVWFDDIIIENVHARKSYTPLGDGCFRYWEKGAENRAILEFEKDAICGSVVIRNVYRHETESSESALIRMTNETSIERLVLENIYQTTAEGVTVGGIEINADIKKRIDRDVM